MTSNSPTVNLEFRTSGGILQGGEGVKFRRFAFIQNLTGAKAGAAFHDCFTMGRVPIYFFHKSVGFFNQQLTRFYRAHRSPPKKIVALSAASAAAAAAATNLSC